MGLISWGGKPLAIETLQETHKKLDKEISILQKARRANRSETTWTELRDKKKQKLLIKSEISRMNSNG